LNLTSHIIKDKLAVDLIECSLFVVLFFISSAEGHAGSDEEVGRRKYSEKRQEEERGKGEKEEEKTRKTFK
jgi:hypothetical protein